MTSTRPANVLWVLVDQMRAQATGYAGDPNVSTPHLDRFAAEGAVFTKAVSAAPLCCPARASMITGRHPARTGVSGHQHPLPADTPSVAREFAAAGYRTCYVGKWHLDGNRPELDESTHDDTNARVRMIPPERRAGFADWWAYENNNRPFDCLVHTDAGRVPPDAAVLDEADGMQQFRLPGYESDSLTDILLSWLRGAKDDPFFAVLSLQPPHNPYTAPPEDMARHVPGRIRLRANVPPIAAVRERARRDLAGYYAAIERIDDNFGRIRSALDELGIADDTHVVFLSDHGDMHGSHGQWRKTSPWEESIRVPFIVGGPSREHQNSARIKAPISHVDLAPTSLGLCGLATPDWMDGVDHSPLITGGATGEEPFGAAHVGIPIPTGHSSSVDQPWDCVVTADDWKYARLAGAPWLMFNLAEDPYELANLAHDPTHRRRRDELEEVLIAASRAAQAGEQIHVPPRPDRVAVRQS